MPEMFDQLILDLLPNGLAWDKTPNSELASNCRQLGQIFYIVERQLDSFISQLSPETCTDDQLKKFQENLGVPIDVSQQGRARAVRAYLSTGNIALKNLVNELEKESGQRVSLTEFIPSLCGKARCGQQLRGQSYIHVYSVSGFELTENTRNILKRYKQAHKAIYHVKPNNTVERI